MKSVGADRGCGINEVCNGLGAGAVLPCGEKTKCCSIPASVGHLLPCRASSQAAGSSSSPSVAGRGKAVQGEDAPSTSRLANASPSALEGEAR